MNPLLQCKPTILPLFIAGVLACFGLLPKTLAVVPAPDGGYPGFNTAEGQNALFSLTTGQGNTAVGWLSLRALTTGSFNTGIGAGALFANTGDENTATGAGALLSNTSNQNTANGAFALFSNTIGLQNVANGYRALFSNTTGSDNTASGLNALGRNTTGGGNTAFGDAALINNTTGRFNTAVGLVAGSNVTTANSVICIGTAGFDVSDSCFIGNIRGAVVSPDAVPVLVDSSHKLGTTSSSRRFKKDIKPIGKASEELLALKPVIFHYKSDNSNTPEFGLIAEEVADVNPNLVVRDKNGEIYTVRYEAINAMLLNEFLKEHKKVEEQQATIGQLKSNAAKQEATISELKKDVGVLTAQLKEQAMQIQTVSAQIELDRPAPRTVLNKP
jgi:hypothetical protein